MSRKGQFSKGQSGNPGGRPKVAAEVRELARQYAPHAVERLHELCDDADGQVAVRAAVALLDRAYGRPAQEVALTGGEGANGERLPVRVKTDDPARAAATATLLARLEIQGGAGSGSAVDPEDE